MTTKDAYRALLTYQKAAAKVVAIDAAALATGQPHPAEFPALLAELRGWGRSLSLQMWAEEQRMKRK